MKAQQMTGDLVMQEGSHLINAKDVCYLKNNAKLLYDVNLHLSAGEILAIVGPNGAGKSTLLKILAGDLQMSQGELTLLGNDVEHWSLQERARHISVLPQLSLLNFPYTVEQVVGLGRIPHQTGVEIDTDIVAHAMDALDIRYLTGRLYPVLSGGEKQRTQIARVFTQIWRAEDAAQRILLLDEPTTALDLGHQQQLMRAIKTMAQQGVAVVMVVHDINLALAHADKVLALQCGEVRAFGETAEVLTESLLQELFSAQLKMYAHADNTRYVVMV